MALKGTTLDARGSGELDWASTLTSVDNRTGASNNACRDRDIFSLLLENQERAKKTGVGRCWGRLNMYVLKNESVRSICIYVVFVMLWDVERRERGKRLGDVVVVDVKEVKRGQELGVGRQAGLPCCGDVPPRPRGRCQPG